MHLNEKKAFYILIRNNFFLNPDPQYCMVEHIYAQIRDSEEYYQTSSEDDLRSEEEAG